MPTSPCDTTGQMGRRAEMHRLVLAEPALASTAALVENPRTT